MSVRSEYEEMTASITPHEEFVRWAKAPKPTIAERVARWFSRAGGLIPDPEGTDPDMYRWWSLDELMERGK